MSACLNIYLDLPFLLECTPNNTCESCSERPMRDFQKIEASKLVTYLITYINEDTKKAASKGIFRSNTYLKKIHDSQCPHPQIDFNNGDDLPSRLKEILNF